MKGYRRAHTFVRNGKTFHRSAARIRAPKTMFLAAVVGLGFLTALGAPQVVVGVVGVCVLASWFTFANRRPLRRIRRLVRR